jgi:cyanophycin synthetase
VGLACRDGLFLENRCVERGDRANWGAGHRLLINRRIEAAVLENGPASILGEGLAYDRCAVGIVTDLEGAEGLAHHDIRDASQMARVLRTQVDVVLEHGTGVLNAGDPEVAALATLCDGQVILYAVDGQAPPLLAHLQAGGRAVRLAGAAAELLHGSGAPPDRLELAAWARAPQPAEAVLAAVAAAWALGIAPPLIRAGIEAFEAELARSTQPTKTH